MDNLFMWSLVVGFLMPPLLAIVQQPQWSSSMRAIVMFVASILAAIGTVFFTQDGEFNKENMATTILTIMVTAIATYTGLWKKTGIAPKIEAVTSRTEAPAPAS